MTELGIFSEKPEEFIPAAEVYGRLREMDNTDPKEAKVIRERLLAGKVIVILNASHELQQGTHFKQEEE